MHRSIDAFINVDHGLPNAQSQKHKAKAKAQTAKKAKKAY
jgi:hypothetical protein